MGVLVGRHRADPQWSGREHELLFWGLFITVVGSVAMAYSAVRPLFNALFSALVLAAFALLWLLSARRLPAAPPAAAVAPAPPRRAGRDGAAQERPGTIMVDIELENPAAMAAPGEASRWTRTFGPPQTGQLPVQQYRSSVVPAAPVQDLGVVQMSHASN